MIVDLKKACDNAARGSKNEEIHEALVEEFTKAALLESFSSFGIQTIQAVNHVVRVGVGLNLGFLPSGAMGFALRQLHHTFSMSPEVITDYIMRYIRRTAIGGGWQAEWYPVFGCNTKCLVVSTRAFTDRVRYAAACAEEYSRLAIHEDSSAYNYRNRVEASMSRIEIGFFRYLANQDSEELLAQASYIRLIEMIREQREVEDDFSLN